MRRFFLVFIFIGISAIASAQYMPGHLEKTHGSLSLDGKKLSKAEQELLLSDICGYDYNQEWKRSNSLKFVFWTQIIAGSLISDFSLLGLVGYPLITAMLEPVPELPDSERQAARAYRNKVIWTSAILFLTGKVAAGSGIPLLVRQHLRQCSIVDYYNGDAAPVSVPRGQLSIGPTPNGMGLSFVF